MTVDLERLEDIEPRLQALEQAVHNIELTLNQLYQHNDAVKAQIATIQASAVTPTAQKFA